MGITVGIDLGTTNSVVAVKKLDLSIITNVDGEKFTPSCVTGIINEKKATVDFIVGRQALNLLKQYPEQTIRSIKRFMGRNFEDVEVQQLINNNRISYKIMTDSSEPGSIYIPLGNIKLTPERISGIILDKLILDSEAELKNKVEQAVVTIPAYFSDKQKFATRVACEQAGIKLLRLLPEPTAAALSFGLESINKEDFRTIMVFDLGGGTFDISVLSLAGGNFMEITKGGDMWLGGDNIDHLLMEYVFSYTQELLQCRSISELIAKLSPKDKARFLVEIKEKTEAAKIALSEKKSVTVELFGILKDEHDQLINIEVTITRKKFNQLIEPIVHKVVSLAKTILHEIRFEPELIDSVLMVGGSSLIVAIQDELKKIFGINKVMLHPRPMFAIAEGAAIMAAKMIARSDDFENQEFLMMHSTSHNYYLQLAEGKNHLLVARNTPLPITVEENLKFTHNMQVLARLRVLNEVDQVLEPVGELWFYKNNPDFDKIEELKLCFTVDENNIITMKAYSLHDQNLSVETQITRGGLATKLYNDLEQALSIMISKSQSLDIEYDLLILSKEVIATIISASDPVSGKINNQQKDRAINQINTLLELQQNNLAILSEYRFGVLAKKQGSLYGIFSETETIRLQNILIKLEEALKNLDNIEHLKQLSKELKNFYNDFPIAEELAEAENVAVNLENSSKSDAKKIRNQAKKLANLYLQQDQSLVQLAKEELFRLINYLTFLWSSDPSKHFYRDVTI